MGNNNTPLDWIETTHWRRYREPLRGLLLEVYNGCFTKDFRRPDRGMGGITEPSIMQANMGRWYIDHNFASYTAAYGRVMTALQEAIDRLDPPPDEKTQRHYHETAKTFFCLENEQQFSGTIFRARQVETRLNQHVSGVWQQIVTKLDEPGHTK